MRKIFLATLASLFVLTILGCKKKKTETPSIPVDQSIPTDNGNGIYSFDVNGIYLEIDSKNAGKVTALRLNGSSFLIPSSVNATNYGNSFWPSPQSMWSWPPPTALDVDAYTGGIDGNSIVLTSKKDPTTGLIFKKEYSVNSEKNYISLKYSMTNQSGTSKSVAPWEITRVYPGGLTLYPSGNNTKTGTLAALTKDSIGHTWFQYNSNTIPSGVPKLFSDGNGGWLAQLNNTVLLIKTFDNVLSSEIAPGEGEIELYANPDKSYIEVEQQGAYAALANNDTRTWEVKWYLKAVPSNTNTGVGSQSLIDLINSTIQ